MFCIVIVKILLFFVSDLKHILTVKKIKFQKI